MPIFTHFDNGIPIIIEDIALICGLGFLNQICAIAKCIICCLCISSRIGSDRGNRLILRNGLCKLSAPRRYIRFNKCCLFERQNILLGKVIDRELCSCQSGITLRSVLVFKLRNLTIRVNFCDFHAAADQLISSPIRIVSSAILDREVNNLSIFGNVEFKLPVRVQQISFRSFGFHNVVRPIRKRIGKRLCNTVSIRHNRHGRFAWLCFMLAIRVFNHDMVIRLEINGELSTGKCCITLRDIRRIRTCFICIRSIRIISHAFQIYFADYQLTASNIIVHISVYNLAFVPYRNNSHSSCNVRIFSIFDNISGRRILFNDQIGAIGQCARHG